MGPVFKGLSNVLFSHAKIEIGRNAPELLRRLNLSHYVNDIRDQSRWLQVVVVAVLILSLQICGLLEESRPRETQLRSYW
jgi:hypothetical protein